MASWRDTITNDILNTPDVKPFDHQKGREALAKVVERAATQISSNSTKAPNRLWSTRHDGNIVVALKLNGHPITVKDAKGVERERFAIPGGQADEVLKALAADIRATDEFDEQIKAVLEGQQTSTGNVAVKKSSGRVTTPEGSVNIAMNNRYYRDLSDTDLEAKLIEKGHDSAIVKAAIKTRKKG